MIISVDFLFFIILGEKSFDIVDYTPFNSRMKEIISLTDSMLS